ncbi:MULTISPECIES: phosphoribosylglycinamide formyltransferase [Vibrio]|uniref:Phosphoribosylglycinamide formyltransferase n=2 Tax=Vibrio owensii TaxID=696485 RepID=A0AAU9QAR9_9VIBR|nr:phosphoribosylglycinamide formyltransferase [Vibrio owensii]MDA0380884.1 phosphoribosylglycinamide formyltransferase [Vibrio owensii]NOI70647.1 phosphoribosylglycinamide formyltransferase [Vibrio owensii]QLK46231.1 phosphoribosylglycinamide formyltransferase [Vibrio owensii]CAH1539557.1 phosphoribosylglycinamide formyltransferase 1 [Vibrio owensii]
MKNIVVLISGNGSNLQAILEACEANMPNAQVAAVFSNKADAYGLERAKQFDVNGHFVDPKAFESREDFDAELMKQIDEYQPDVIVLAGYMRILSSAFVSHYLGKMINIHPSLLPKYPGLHTHQRAIDAGDKEHGTSVHFVTEELDGGPVVLQAKVPVFEDDDADALAARVQTQEHNIYPMVTKWLVDGRLSMTEGKAYLDGFELGAHGYAAE